ncbi:unnamed protein product [Diabrotica balteata]|uniref:acid phosphatase n=1 Tax=Diabrotica balteata TaxID=107213 RepID=A0A9N9XAH1_DIABA|nr:unnamed protein product [Diabrotica balteata]
MNRCGAARLAIAVWNILLLFTPVYFSLIPKNASTEDSGTLVAVVVIYRHGDRAPLISFPRDEYYNMTYWPMGFGHLTKYGVTRLYNLGKWFRERYKNFLSETYSPDEIYIHSSNIDRCLMSASAALAGLYPPTGFQFWNPQLSWQPIPVHTDNKNHDEIITEKRRCKKYEDILLTLQNATYPSFKRNYTELFQFVSDKTGWTVSLPEIKTLYSVLNSYNSYNSSFVPEWIENINLDIVETLAAVVYGLPSSTTEIARLRIGPFYQYMFDLFDTFVTSSSFSMPKFLMVSAHDTTLSAALGAMKAFRKPVKFGETLIWELKQDNNGTFFINTYYKTEDKISGINLMDCSFDCDYSIFKKKLSSITVSYEDWAIECNN